MCKNALVKHKPCSNLHPLRSNIGSRKGTGVKLAKKDPFQDQNKPLETRLLRYVWQHTRAEQIWILFVIIASMPTYFLVLDLPVRIINQPIQGRGFEQVGATQQFLEINFGLPDFLGGQSWQLFEGFTLERWPYLIALSCLFLGLVCINGLFKFYINTYKGRLGERMLRRMRYSLVDRVLRFPIPHFKRVKGSEVASMVKDEIEPFGEFIGDAFVQPVYLGGQALVAFAFILNQSFWLGMIAVSIIAVQMVLIPYLRRRVLELGRMRQLTARLLSGRIGEIVDGITSVHVNDTSNYERAEISSRLGDIFFIRYELYQRKFVIKFINNLLAQLTPFLFYVVGGYFAIRGSLNVGQLLGVINAYKDLPSPINGLIMWDQKRTDINIKYAQIIEQFNVKGMSDARLQEPSSEPAAPLTGDIEVSNLAVTDETGTVLLEDADFVLPINSITAAVGQIGSGAGATANVLAGITNPTSGRVRLGGQLLQDLPQSIRGRRFAYAGTETYLPQSTLMDTLLYVNKHAPLHERDLEALGIERHPRFEAEVLASGNTLLDYHADWVDYEAMGIKDESQLLPKLHDVLSAVEMKDTVYDLALRQPLNKPRHAQLREKLLEVRAAMRSRIEGSDLSELVEVWDRNKYNDHANIAENLLFGSAMEESQVSADALVANDYVRAVLRDGGLEKDLFAMGVELAETAIELFADLSPDNPFFEQLNFMTPEQLENYPPILARARELGFDGVEEEDRKMILKLPLSYEEQRNRLRLLDDGLRDRILEVRKRFHENMPEEMRDQFSVYELTAYNSNNSVQDNILFGRIAHGSSNAADRVGEVIRELLGEFDLGEAIFRVGLEFDIGTGGKRLSENQRQRLLVARALLKGADMIFLNRALNTLDARQQERIIQNILVRARGETGGKPFGVFMVLATARYSQLFDHVMMFQRQRLLAHGTPEILMNEQDAYAQLVA